MGRRHRKTTTATRFMLVGAERDKTCLHVTLSKTEEELHNSAATYGLALYDRISIFEVVPAESLLHPLDFELGEATRQISAAFECVRPQRVVIGSLFGIRLLAQGTLR